MKEGTERVQQVIWVFDASVAVPWLPKDEDP
jgi:hypothetical protein